MGNEIIYFSVISSKAQKEIAVSWTWYEERLKGLGDKFLKEAVEKISKIQQFPERVPTKYKQYRERTLDTFPFIIIYRINKKKKVIRIVSVFHTSRHPKTKY
jgi:plasmid stabilization system protein ParE